MCPLGGASPRPTAALLLPWSLSHPVLLPGLSLSPDGPAGLRGRALLLWLLPETISQSVVPVYLRARVTPMSPSPHIPQHSQSPCHPRAHVTPHFMSLSADVTPQSLCHPQS